MSIRIEIQDGITPLLDKILELNYGVALESLSIAGAAVQTAARSAMIKQTHNWYSDVIDGKRRIFKAYRQPRELGLRISHDTASVLNPRSMANFINSYLMEKHLVVVIGGGHPSFTPKRRVNGIVVGNMPTIKATSRGTQAILNKLNTGELTEEYSRKSMPRFKGAQYVKNRNFMLIGANSAKGDVLSAMTTRYEALLHKAVNNATIRVVKRGSI